MDGRGSDRSPDDDLHGRKLVERVLRDTIKKVVETGVEKISEGPENLRNFVGDLKLPKEIATYLLSQIDETKNGLYRVVAKEIRGFLQQNDLGEEIARALGHLAVEIKTEYGSSRRRTTPAKARRPSRKFEPRCKSSPTDRHRIRARHSPDEFVRRTASTSRPRVLSLRARLPRTHRCPPNL